MSSLANQFEPRLMQDIIRDTLLQHLRTLPVGQRLPPLKCLAQQLKLGQNNLRGAMRDLAEQGLVYSRPRLGTFVAREMTWADTSATAAPSQRRTRREISASRVGCKVQIVLTDIDDSLLQVVQGALATLRSQGVHVEQTPSLKIDGQYAVSNVHADALLLVNPSSTLHPSAEALLSTTPCVIASTNWHPRTVARVPCDLVGVDQWAGSALVGKTLRHADCRDVCFLGRRDSTGEYDGTSAMRLEGFESGWGASVPEEYRLNCKGYSVLAGARGFCRWMQLPHRPGAIFAVCDEVAVGFCAAAMGHGLLATKDFQLIGFDGLALGQRGPDPLTTVQAPFHTMGQIAADMLSHRLQDPGRPQQATYLAPHLLPGKTARVPGPSDLQ